MRGFCGLIAIAIVWAPALSHAQDVRRILGGWDAPPRYAPDPADLHVRSVENRLRFQPEAWLNAEEPECRPLQQALRSMRFDEAVEQLFALADALPADRGRRALLGAVRLSAALGDEARAATGAAEYLSGAEPTDPALRSVVGWLAEHHHRRGELVDAIALHRRVATSSAPLEEQLEAWLAVAALESERGRWRAAGLALRRAVRSWEPSERTGSLPARLRSAGAAVRFAQAAQLHRQLDALELPSFEGDVCNPEARQRFVEGPYRRWLRRAIRGMTRTEEAYRRVLRLGDAHLTVASLTRIAESSFRVDRHIRSVPDPIEAGCFPDEPTGRGAPPSGLRDRVMDDLEDAARVVHAHRLYGPEAARLFRLQTVHNRARYRPVDELFDRRLRENDIDATPHGSWFGSSTETSRTQRLSLNRRRGAEGARQPAS